MSNWQAISADVDIHSAYVYTGADLSNTSTPDEKIIVLYSRPFRSLPEWRVVAFADGHADFVRAKNLEETFAVSNAARAKRGLPPFALDGPVPVAPVQK